MASNRKSNKWNEYVVSVMEAVRISAVLETAEEKLQLLAMLSSDSSPFEQVKGPDPAEENNNGSVAHILEEQKRLEARYEELLQQRGIKKSNNKRIFTSSEKHKAMRDASALEEEEEVMRVAEQLKETTLLLCRHLKENPNEADNWRKIQMERTELQNTLSKCVRELSSGLEQITQIKNASTNGNTNNGFDNSGEDGNGGVAGSVGGNVDSARLMAGDLSVSSNRRSSMPLTPNTAVSSVSSFSASGSAAAAAAIDLWTKREVSYEHFMKSVYEEKERKQLQDDIMEREKEMVKNVKRLQQEVANEKALKEKEIEERTTKVSELKSELRALKKSTKEENERLRAEIDAELQCKRRKERAVIRELEIQWMNLKTQLEVERKVHEQTKLFYEKNLQELQEMAQRWDENHERDTGELGALVDTARRKREAQIALLKDLEDRYAKELEAKRVREEEERQRKLEEERLQEELRIKSKLVTKIQAAWRGYFTRKTLEEEKKKKKGKKGAKKGAKKGGKKGGKKPKSTK